MAAPREVRLKPIPDRFIGGKWLYASVPIVKLGEVGKWAMVRHADSPQAMPTVLSVKDWEKLEVRP